MGWFNKLFGLTPEKHSEQTTHPTLSFPARITIIPECLSVRIYLHDMETRDGSVPCWTYVTEGMLVHQQKEFVFSLRREPDEEPTVFPREPVGLFKYFFEIAQQGHTVDVGGFTQFAEPNFFGRHLTYIEPQTIVGIELPVHAITALLITEDEVLTVQQFGITRVMSRLGFASRYYPCPPWSERKRPGISFAATLEQSILRRIGYIGSLKGLHVNIEAEEVHVRLNPASTTELQHVLEQTPTDEILLLLPDLDVNANACLVWEPGQDKPFAISPEGSDGSRIGACFLMICPEQNHDHVHQVEDGITVLLTDATWASVREALLAQNSLRIQPENGTFSITFSWMIRTLH
jgi:Domain of unknown function (DUF3480)